MNNKECYEKMIKAFDALAEDLEEVKEPERKIVIISWMIEIYKVLFK